MYSYKATNIVLRHIVVLVCIALLYFSLTVVACPPLMDPLDGDVVWTNLSVGSVAVYTCNRRFELVGNDTRTCQGDGMWSGEEPVCTGVLKDY